MRGAKALEDAVFSLVDGRDELGRAIERSVIRIGVTRFGLPFGLRFHVVLLH